MRLPLAVSDSWLAGGSQKMCSRESLPSTVSLVGSEGSPILTCMISDQGFTAFPSMTTRTLTSWITLV